MILRWYFQDGRYRLCVTINDVPNQFCDILIYQDNVDIVSLHETLETIFDLTDSGIYGFRPLNYQTKQYIKTLRRTLIDHHKIRVPILVNLSYPTQ